MKSLALADLQQRFKDVVKNKIDGLDEVLTPRDEYKTRLHIYQYAFSARLQESLDEDFEQVRAQLGEKLFSELTEKYISVQPSLSWTVAEFSEAFPGFLKTHVAEKYIYDLAEFEWIKIKCSLGAATHTFDPQSLINATEAEWVLAKMKIVPSLMIYSSHWSVNESDVLKDNRSEDQIYCYALFRSTHGLKVLALSSAEIDLLEEMSFGKNFGELAQNFSDKGIPVEQVGAAVGAWVQEGLIEKVVFCDTKIS